MTLEDKPLILVVDDEESNIIVFKRPLAKAGYTVIGASGGAAALAAAAQNDIDVILMDWMMPGMSGVEAAAAIKATAKGRLIPVIMVTAKSGQSDIKAGLDAGADDYITKPVKMEEALARIRSALRQRALEKGLHEANEQLLRLMALKDDFLNIASHDIRTPLTAILGFADELQREDTGPLNDTQKHHLNIIVRAGKRQLKLVNDLLDLARIETGKDEPRKTPVVMDSLLAETCESMLYTAKEKEIALSCAKGCPEALMADEGKILRVLSNLAGNAIKFTPKGGAVAVSCKAEAGECIVTVADSGVGIPPEELPKLFGKFAKLSSRPTAGEHGSGLGLSITKHIIEMHGGRIWAESAPGRGTSLHFALPLGR
ncbi:MAG: response regulator [Nitrospinae bacterium]|nr:response regulator [Nitrospinota bacterium]